MVLNLIKEETIKIINEDFGIGGHVNDVDILYTEDFKNGDAYTTFPLKLFGSINKQIKQHSPESYIKDGSGVSPYGKIPVSDPLDLAKKFVDIFLKKNFSFIEDVKVARNGFINFYIKDEYIAKEIENVDENFGKNESLKGKKIMVEYTDPNPFKIFHIGHLMTNAIGESFARLNENSGAKVLRACYQGDVGLHVAKTIWGILKEKEKFPNENEDLLKRIEFLGQAYVKGTNAYEIEENAKIEIDALNKRIFDKSDQEINHFYDLGRKWSLEYFEEIYKKVDTKFDQYFFESEVAQEGSSIVLDNPNVFEKSDGAYVFKGSHTRVFINSLGLPTYEAKELGLTKEKYDIFPDIDDSLIITANEQNDYFKIIKEVVAKIFPKYKVNQFGHGMFRMASGKMSSRKGNIVSAEDLINSVQDIVKEKIEDKEISEKIAIAAIKYSILRQAVGGDIIYDEKRATSFEGDSGPYLQYSTVRANSVLKKAKEQNIDQKIEKTEVQNLDRLLTRYPEIVLRAQKELAPNHVITYLTQLAGEFNSFYTNNKILDAGELTGYRLALTQAFVNVMKNGLHILAIKVPERM